MKCEQIIGVKLVDMVSGLILMVWAALCHVSGVRGNAEEDALLTELFDRRTYNRLTRPVRDLTDTIHVQMGIVMQKIVQVDELHEVMHANMWSRLKWGDYRLKWNASEFGEVAKIYVPVSRLWIPDITLWNNAQVEKGSSDRETQFAMIYSHGLVHWWTPIEQSTAHCPMDITWFPLDTQHCPLIYESWAMPSVQLNISGLEPAVDFSYYQKSGEWQLLDVPMKLSLTMYDCCSSPFSRVTFTVNLRRKSLYYVINLVVPCCLFSIIAVITFILPAASGERVGIGITILLALSVYQMIVNDKLPATSDAVPLLGVYFTFVMLISAISVSVTMLVLCVYHQAPSNTAATCTPVPRWVRLYICGRLAELLRMKTVTSCDVTPNDAIDQIGQRPTSKGFLCDFSQNDQKQEKGTLYEDTMLSAGASDNQKEENCLKSTSDVLHSIHDNLETKLHTEFRLRKQAEQNQQTINEWILAAAVIDRVCFIVFGLVFFIGTGVLFFLAMFAER